MLVITLLLMGLVVAVQISIAQQDFHDASFGIEFLPLIPATFLFFWFFIDFFTKSRLQSFGFATFDVCDIGIFYQ